MDIQAEIGYIVDMLRGYQPDDFADFPFGKVCR